MKVKYYLVWSSIFVLSVSLPFNDLGCMDTLPQEPENRDLSEDENEEILNKLYSKLDPLFEANGQKYNKNMNVRGVKSQIFEHRFMFPPLTFNPTIDADENKRKIQEICDFVYQIPQLRSLYLFNLKLDEVPPGIQKLTSVKLINLSKNNIKTIPGNEIRSLNLLDNLDLSDNPIVQESGDPMNWGVKELLENGFYIPDPQKPLVFKSKKSYVRQLYIPSNINRYVGYFFSDVPGSGAQQNPIPSTGSLKEMVSSVIFNEYGIEDKVNEYNKSYKLNDALKEDPNLFKKGNSLFIPAGQYEIPSPLVSGEKLNLTIDHEVPIGYQVYLPKDPDHITAVYVDVYGGNIRNGLMKLESPSPEYAYLLNHGVAVVLLNLLDLYELKVDQAVMPLDVHEKLHLSIDCFLKTLKNNPEVLGIDKNQLKGKKIVLKGASFGGRTAVRHAELYPGTFDGYISHDGALDYTMMTKVQSRVMTITEHFEEWVDPSGQRWVELIKDPILLLQNFDDNTTGAQMTTSFYKKARQSHKDVQLLVSPQGQPMGQGWEAQNKGHFSPTDENDFKKYMGTILHFIFYGTSKLGVMSDWSADKYDVYANAYLNRNYDVLPLKDKFISWALRIENYRRSEDYRKQITKHYEGGDIPEGVKPLLAPTHHESWKMFENPDITLETTYDALAYLEEHKDVVLNSKQLTDDAINNMLLYHLPLFVDYLFENDNDISKVFSREELVKQALDDKTTISAYRNLLMGDDKDLSARYYLLRILFIANPSLLAQFRKEKLADSAYQREKQEALKEFDGLAQKMKDYPKKAWKAAFHAVQSINRSGKL